MRNLGAVQLHVLGYSEGAPEDGVFSLNSLVACEFKTHDRLDAKVVNSGSGRAVGLVFAIRIQTTFHWGLEEESQASKTTMFSPAVRLLDRLSPATEAYYPEVLTEGGF